MPLIHDDPVNWRARAKEAIALAQKMGDLRGIALMAEIAERYDDLAKRTQARMSEGEPGTLSERAPSHIRAVETK
jgi:hypothetical protein